MLKIEVIGNLGADAEVKSSNGSEFVTFRVAHTSKYKKQDGTEVESTDWVDCILSNAQSKVVPYLKQGVKVFVRGNGGVDVYSSKKERRMKGKLTCNVLEVELCGGAADDVPREIIDPNDGTIHQTQKFYWCDVQTKGMKATDVRQLIDARGRLFMMNNKGFVAPMPDQEHGQTTEEQTNQEQK